MPVNEYILLCAILELVIMSLPRLEFCPHETAELANHEQYKLLIHALVTLVLLDVDRALMIPPFFVP
jgi:hypothetical protein